MKKSLADATSGVIRFRGVRSSPAMNRVSTRPALPLGLALALLSLASCGGGGGGGGGAGAGIIGEELAKPGGGTFFVDPNRGGSTTRLHLAEMYWGRLVDIHDVDANGLANPEPVFRDFVIGENAVSDGGNYLLDTNPITQRTRLVILRRRGFPDNGTGTFDELLRQAARGLAPVLPRGLNGAPPFSLVARNSAVVLRFDDCLNDSTNALMALLGDNPTVQIQVGPEGGRQPFLTRLLFDPNFGGIAGGAFHSTRVILDMTVSVTEAAGLVSPRPVNSVGLPASELNEPNVVVRIPTETDPAGGQFDLLTALSGAPLSRSGNGPLDTSTPTQDVVRVMRAGNAADSNGGFLLDLEPPEVLGGWDMTIDRIGPNPLGQDGFDFLADITFANICRTTPQAGAVLNTNGLFLGVSQTGSVPDSGGRVLDLRVRNLGDQPIPLDGVGALGRGLFLSTYDPAIAIPGACWLSFSPPPGALPATDVSTSVEAIVRFSEPMNRNSMSPYDTFQMVRGDSNTTITASNLVPADIGFQGDLRTFTLTPRLPLGHDPGTPDAYNVRVNAVTDLAGNGLANPLPAVNFTIDPDESEVHNGAVVMRFGSLDEIEPIGLEDFRGQFFIDTAREQIRPRPVQYTGYPADRINPVPSIMVPFPRGVQTPLSPLGSKLQTVWRYCDLGWQIKDETKYNLDVFGLSWAPIGGLVLSDFYENFEIALSHSRFQPDEDIDNNLLPKHVNSGLRGRGSNFTDNIHNDPLSPQKVVHPRDLGYRVSAANLFFAESGTRMLPFPLNRDPSVETQTYTWRDTAALGEAAPSARGVPLDIEVGAPLQLEGAFGAVARAGEVPTIGLPLLMEYRCFPTSSGVGLNSFDISLAINSSAWPAFRAYSTGGINTSGVSVIKDPDRETSPSGGYNPSTNPPGNQTRNAHDNSFYIGQLDVVTRISRVHTAWIDTRMPAPDFIQPQVLPAPQDQPVGTSILIEYRGSNGFVLEDLDMDVDESLFPFDARRLDPYGDIVVDIPDAGDNPIRWELGSTEFTGSVDYVGDGPQWSGSIDEMDGARYLQMRITFLSNIETFQSPVLSAIGLAFSE
jgi:hypothetical protein